MLVRRPKGETVFYHTKRPIVKAEYHVKSIIRFRGARSVSTLCKRIPSIIYPRYNSNTLFICTRIFDFMFNFFGDPEQVEMSSSGSTFAGYVLKYDEMLYVVLTKRNCATHDDLAIYVITDVNDDEAFFSDTKLQQELSINIEHFLVDFFNMRDEYYNRTE